MRLNAILNYLYSILESESRIAALVVGLNPGIGIDAFRFAISGFVGL